MSPRQRIFLIACMAVMVLAPVVACVALKATRP